MAPVGEVREIIRLKPWPWVSLWISLGLLLAWRCSPAILSPTPRHVQSSVRLCIFFLIFLDAGVVLAVREFSWAVPILLLLLPTIFLGRWIYST